MTNTERAEKIRQTIIDYLGPHLAFQEGIQVIDVITAQLDQAVREAHNEKCCHCDCHELIVVGDGCFTCIDQRSNARREGFAAAREKAAGIAARHEDNSGYYVGLLIRAMEADK